MGSADPSRLLSSLMGTPVEFNGNEHEVMTGGM